VNGYGLESSGLNERDLRRPDASSSLLDLCDDLMPLLERRLPLRWKDEARVTSPVGLVLLLRLGEVQVVALERAVYFTKVRVEHRLAFLDCSPILLEGLCRNGVADRSLLTSRLGIEAHGQHVVHRQRRGHAEHAVERAAQRYAASKACALDGRLYRAGGRQVDDGLKPGREKRCHEDSGELAGVGRAGSVR